MAREDPTPLAFSQSLGTASHRRDCRYWRTPQRLIPQPMEQHTESLMEPGPPYVPICKLICHFKMMRGDFQNISRLTAIVIVGVQKCLRPRTTLYRPFISSSSPIEMRGSHAESPHFDYVVEKPWAPHAGRRENQANDDVTLQHAKVTVSRRKKLPSVGLLPLSHHGWGDIPALRSRSTSAFCDHGGGMVEGPPAPR